MNAESIMASPDGVITAAQENSISIKIYGYNSRGESKKMKDGGSCGFTPALVTIADGAHGGCQEHTYEEDIIQLHDEAITDDLYYIPDISPEDELALMKEYCLCLKSEGKDISDLILLLKAAKKEIESGYTEEFYTTIDSFYNMYENLCSGKGGRLFASGDYLAFSEETVMVNFSCRDM